MLKSFEQFSKIPDTKTIALFFFRPCSPQYRHLSSQEKVKRTEGGKGDNISFAYHVKIIHKIIHKIIYELFIIQSFPDLLTAKWNKKTINKNRLI